MEARSIEEQNPAGLLLCGGESVYRLGEGSRA